MKKILYFVLFLLFTTNICFASDVDLNKFVNEYGQEVQNIIKSNLNYNGTENATTAVN